MRNVLVERAKRHGLTFRYRNGLEVWSDAHGTRFVIGEDDQGQCCWVPGDEFSCQSIVPRYRTSEEALAAALAWMDATNPGRVRPDVGAPFAEILRMLKALERDSWLAGSSQRVARERIGTAVRILQTLAGPLAEISDETRLSLALDLCEDKGELTPAAERAVVRAIRRWPETLRQAKVAMWFPDINGLDEWHLLDLGSLDEHVRSLGFIEEENGHWHWRIWDGPLPVAGISPTCEQARMACAVQCSSAGWRVLMGTPVSDHP